MEFWKDLKVYSSGDCITQHNRLAFDFEIRKIKDTRRKIWKLHQGIVKSNFTS